MSIPSALQKPETDRDDATELVPPIALIIESDEDEATAATDGGLSKTTGLVPQTAPHRPEALSPRVPASDQSPSWSRSFSRKTTYACCAKTPNFGDSSRRCGAAR